MTSRQLDEEAIFHVARDLADPGVRSTYLEQVCAGDQALRERVEALLAVHEREQSFLKSEGGPAPTVDSGPVTEAPGQRIGRYQLLQKIGEGGFGVVYMAEQERPVRRKVALKIIKPGMDTHAVVARFEAERQALALMDHPNIARVFDGGATDSGRPYFVMELVKGVPITKYCDNNQVATEQRLELFMVVCHAVQHAHQKGIIHRDLKPSNVLVTLADGQPVVKVIDFGVAKAMNQQLTEKTLFTAYGQMVGTPQYMSPEQAEMSCLDVDTRSDIYSLGVLLYELLTGTTPLDADRLRTAGYAEMQRLIREAEPPKPSTRLSGADERLTIIAKHRSETPERLHRLIRGDLDWIVMKALEKDRGRRYETASAVAADVQRHFRNEPITARPASRTYQLRKFVRRNKVSVVTGAAVTLTALVSAAVIFVVYVRLYTAYGRLQDAFTYQAIVEAMAVDEKGMEEAISEAIRAGASSTWRSMLQALMANQDGHPEEAIRLLEDVCRREPNNTAACAMLATAYFNAGDADKHEQKVRELSDMSTSNDFDILFKASTEARLWNIAPALHSLQDLVKEQPSWELARVMLAKAKVFRAWDTGDWREAAEAAATIRASRERLPDVMSAYSVELMANLAAMRLAPTDIAVEADWEKTADRVAKVLVEKYAHAAFRELAIYYFLRSNSVEQAITVLDEACRVQKRSIADSFRLGMLLGEKRYNEMVGTSGTFDLYAELELHDDPREVSPICDNYIQDLNDVTVEAVWSRVILCACGRQDEAIQWWNEQLDSKTDILWNLKYSMMILTGRWSAEEALNEAGESRIRRSLVHFAVASRALYVERKREYAKEHFQQCVDIDFFDVDYYYWARSYLTLLEDPAWPHWLSWG